jgi:K+-sensing histidine kinase KdpD
MEINVEQKKFLLLKKLAKKINSSAEINEVIQEALDGLLEVLGLQCTSVTLWDERTKNITSQLTCGAIEKVKVLCDFYEKILQAMREQINVESIYATFDSEGPHSAFSYPVKKEGVIIGAITGLDEGYKNLSHNEELLEAVSNLLATAATKGAVWMEKMNGEIHADLVKSERLKAIVETSVTISHEINNPLAAITGYVQLILSRPEKLDQDTIDKLKKIETGATRIKDVTTRLLKIVEPVVVRYAGDVRMVDLNQSKTKEDKK